MRRHVLGILAILFLAAGLLLFMQPNLVDSSQTWSGIGVRVGTVLGVLWLAFPQLDRLPKGLFLILIVLGIVLARWRTLFPFAIVIIAVMLILRPRSPRKQTDRSTRADARRQ